MRGQPVSFIFGSVQLVAKASAFVVAGRPAQLVFQPGDLCAVLVQILSRPPDQPPGPVITEERPLIKAGTNAAVGLATDARSPGGVWRAVKHNALLPTRLPTGNIRTDVHLGAGLSVALHVVRGLTRLAVHHTSLIPVRAYALTRAHRRAARNDRQKHGKNAYLQDSHGKPFLEMYEYQRLLKAVHKAGTATLFSKRF